MFAPPRGGLRVLGIAGSLRTKSYNRALLRAAVELAPDGMEVLTFERLRELPPFDSDVDQAGPPEPVLALKDAIAGAHALLIATPEYNYGVPGVLKNAIDWASRPFNRSPLNRKPAAIMGASAGSGGTRRAQMDLRMHLLGTQSYAMPAPEVLVYNARDRFDEQLRLIDEATATVVRGMLASLADWTARFPEAHPAG
jgi:chromate reductase